MGSSINSSHASPTANEPRRAVKIVYFQDLGVLARFQPGFCQNRKSRQVDEMKSRMKVLHERGTLHLEEPGGWGWGVLLSVAVLLWTATLIYTNCSICDF